MILNLKLELRTPLRQLSPPVNEQFLNDINRGRIEKSIVSQFDAQNLKLVDRISDAEVIVYYELGLDENINYSTTTNDMGGWGRWYGPGGTSTSTTTQYKTYTGNLTISIVDAEEETLLWYATGSKSIKTSSNRDEDVNRSVEKIIESLPVAD